MEKLADRGKIGMELQVNSMLSSALVETKWCRVALCDKTRKSVTRVRRRSAVERRSKTRSIVLNPAATETATLRP
jgi:hypothetical protein